MNLDLEKRKILVSGSIASIILLATLINGIWLETYVDSNEPGERSIASLSEEAKALHLRNTRQEHELAKNLSKLSTRKTATLGLPPTELEKLIYESLNGKYRVQLNENNKLVEIKTTSLDSQNLVYINDKLSFINKYKILLPTSFDFIDQQTETRTLSSNNKSESYFLKNKMGMTLSKISFETNSYGALLGVKVTNSLNFQ